ncbi:hypothetical protein B0E47_04975 [Rhodanobacter sp. B05]|nr:hypothetical protein B0E47_04975 [Rhodanobacter sp. B05]
MSRQRYADEITSAGRTNAGKVRTCNEDAILDRPNAGLWVVADGLGGHAAGDYASRLIVKRWQHCREWRRV